MYMFTLSSRVCATLAGLLCLWAAPMLLFPAELEAKTVWVKATGEATLLESKTVRDVKKEALSNARRAAVEHVVGVNIQSNKLLRDTDTDSDFIDLISSWSSGQVLDEVIEGWQTEQVRVKELALPLTIYRVHINAEVAVQEGDADPNFKLKADLNREVFKDGDPVKVTIAVSKDCYVNVFVITEQSEVYQIFPNSYSKNNFMEAGKTMVFPAASDIKNGVDLRAVLLPEHKKAKEAVKVIATRKPLAFIAGTFTEGVGIKAYQSGSASLKTLMRELIDIPPAQKVEVNILYQILR